MRSWVPGAEASDFGIDNLPLGVFSTHGNAPRAGVAIGDFVADLTTLHAAGLIDEPALHGARTLNAFLATGRQNWTALRARLQHLFGTQATSHDRAFIEAVLVARSAVTMHMPIDVQDYVDFYSSIEHATNVGKIFRPDHPLLPNYRHLPIGYHGRSSSVVLDGTPIVRPNGQTKDRGAEAPTFGPTQMLDFELELGFITGPGNVMGVPIPISQVRDHVYGYVMLNDWSARDVQSWETQPLGPFLSKSFATSISPWLISLDALEPFRVDNRVLDPQALPYLQTSDRWAYDVELEVLLETAAMRASGSAPATITRTNFRNMYWNLAQQLAHLTSSGSVVRPADLFGTGTISGTQPGTYGSMIELTMRGVNPLTLPNGEQRPFLEDGDTVIMRARAKNAEACIGFGEVRGTIIAAPAYPV